MIDPKTLPDDEFLNWFEQVYAQAQANGTRPPWTIDAAHPHLKKWAEREALDGAGKTALVVGCGWGDDAEYLATLGFDVTAFDISETAIQVCQERFPASAVAYVVADLFALPAAWQGAFDFVLENRTVQALPPRLTQQAIRAEAALVAPRGHLLVLCWGRDDDTPREGIPWPLAPADLQPFVAAGLSQRSFETLHTQNGKRLRVVYQRAAAP